MHLITMAHHGEAQGVIEKFQLKKIKSDLWGSEEMMLLLTGEGPFEAATRTALELSSNSIKEIINLGIAGSLSKEISIGEFIPVRTLYLAQDLKPLFKTFQVGTEGEDCVTSFERILDPEKASILRGLGKLVDREAWGVAMAAKIAGIPMRCFKVVSDDAGKLGACEIVKNQAEELSYQLAEGLTKIMMKSEEISETIYPQGFHFTFSHKHKFDSLLQKLTIKQERTPELPLEEIQQLDISPKEKTKKLIEWMENSVDPVKKVLSDASQKLQTNFKSNGFDLRMDPTWENQKLVISLEAADDAELKKKLEILNTLSIQPFTEIMKGNFHVE